MRFPISTRARRRSRRPRPRPRLRPNWAPQSTWNRFGTPSSVYNLDGNLATGIPASTAVDAARTWLNGNTALFGLAGADGLTLVRDTPLADGGGHAILLGQSFDGVLAAPDGLVTVAVAGSAADGWNVTYASSSLARNDSVANDYTLSPEQAWVQAANSVGEQVSTDDVTVAGSEDGWTELDVDGFDETQSVREAAFPVPGTEARAAFQTLIVDGDNLGYAQTVDASSGQILARMNTVDNAIDNPTWKAFPAFPLTIQLNAFPWNYPSTDTRELWCWAPVAGCDRVVGNPANAAAVPMPWDQTDPAGPSTFTTRGNNANSRENWLTVEQPAAPGRHALPADERDAGLRVSVDERVVHLELRPGEPRRSGHGAPRAGRERHLGRGQQPVRACTTAARLRLPPRLHRGRVERRSRTTSARRRRSSATTRSRVTRRPAGITRRLPRLRRPRQREHEHAAPTARRP